MVLISLLYARLGYSSIDMDNDSTFNGSFLNCASDSILITDFEDILRKWIYYYQKSINLEDFDLVKIEKLSILWSRVKTFDFGNDIYFPFYKFSPDKTKVLDLIGSNIVLEKNENQELISYGGDIDNQVFIKDIKNLKWNRTLFLGSLYKIEDGFWISDNMVAIVGQYDNENEQSKPMIWLIDLHDYTCMTFEYKFYITIKTDYQERVLYQNIKLMY